MEDERKRTEFAFCLSIREWTAENREINGADRGKRGGGGGKTREEKAKFNEIDADGRE